MIHVLLEAAFTPRVLAQAAFGVLGVDLLQPLAAEVVAVRACFTVGAAEVLALAIGGQIDDAQINTQRPAIRFGLGGASRLWVTCR